MHWLLKVVILMSLAVVIIAACSARKSKSNEATVDPVNESEIQKGGLYPVKEKNKWGYLNERLQWAISPKFETAEEFRNGFAVVSQRFADGKTLAGFIDSTGKLVINFRYDKALPFSEGLAAVNRNGKYGYIDESGVEKIPLQYDDASGFSEGLACVQVNGRNGFIDKTGNMVIQPKFARACWVSDFSEGFAAVYESENGNGGYIDKHGVMALPLDFKYVGRFSGGLALVQVKESARFGYINTQGKFVIKPEYDAGVAFFEGVATVKLTRPNGKSVFRVIDESGSILADDLAYAFVGIFRDGLAGVETFDNRWGFIDRTGREVIAPTYASVRLFHNGLSRVETGSLFGGLKMSYINKQGNIVWANK